MYVTQRLKTETVDKVEKLTIELIQSKKLDKMPASFDDKLEILLNRVKK